MIWVWAMGFLIQCWERLRLGNTKKIQKVVLAPKKKYNASHNINMDDSDLLFQENSSCCTDLSSDRFATLYPP